MDNNQPTQPQASTVQQPIQASAQNSEEKKLILWLVGGLILIILVVGVIYWFLSKQAENTAKPTQQEEATKAPQLTLQALNEQLETELNSLEVQAPDSDFQEIDQDLQNL